LHLAANVAIDEALNGATDRHTTVRVVIHDLDDIDLVADTRAAIHEAFRDHRGAQAWVVAVTASQTRGWWDVSVRGPAGRHDFSFRSSPPLVPQFVRHHLVQHLAGLVRQ
jgi:hypothetical protein